MVTALDQLTEDELVMILTDTKNAMVKQYTKLLRDGRREPERHQGRPARARRPGRDKGHRRARAARMLERIMLDIMYDVPSRDDIADVTINRAVVEGKKAR